MNRLAYVLLIACARPGSTPNSPIPPEPPSTEPKPAEPIATKPDEPSKPSPPPPPAKEAHDASVTTAKPTVKLVSAGSGKKSKLAIAATAGKLGVDWELGFTATSDGKGQTLPDIVFHTDADVSATANDTTAYKLVLKGIDLKDVPGETRPDHFELALAPLAGLVIAGSVHGDGTRTDIALHHDSVDPQTAGAIDQLVKPGILSWWPVLPADAIGTGAKWEVTTPREIGLSPEDMLKVDETITYELVSRKDKTAEIKGTIKVTGAVQDIAGAKITNIGGGGTFTATLVDGLFATTHADVATRFEVAVPEEKGTGTHKFELKFSNDVVAKK